MSDKKKILIVDDDPDFIRTMEFYLKSVGFDIITAFDERAALQNARLKPDLILLDLKMPGTSGHKICKHLKEEPGTSSIPIIMLTSQNETMDKVEALNIGVADYVGKTFPLEEILARINAALRDKTADVTAEMVDRRNRKISELKNVIDSGLISVTYLPIVDISNNGSVGYDTVLRGPEGTFLESRDALYTTASEAGRVVELDDMCRRQAILKATFLAHEHVLFIDTDQSVIFSDSFKELAFLDNSPLSPKQICVKLRESDCVNNLEKIKESLAPVRDKGLKIAIYDARADYSGLKAIERMAPDFIMLDIGLIRCIDIDQIKKSIVRTIVTLAENIGSSLIAEGIEADYECSALSELGVKYGQGPLFS
jgi:EAL domain-containing protein (putative c-di-GMP-specific phosphodiesterase class I)